MAIAYRRLPGRARQLRGPAPRAWDLSRFPPHAPGLVGYFSSPLLFAGLAATGTPGEPGDGSLHLPLSVVEVMVGQTVFLQAWAVDFSSGFDVLQTNGLVLRFGRTRHVTALSAAAPGFPR